MAPGSWKMLFMLALLCNASFISSRSYKKALRPKERVGSNPEVDVESGVEIHSDPLRNDEGQQPQDQDDVSRAMKALDNNHNASSNYTPFLDLFEGGYMENDQFALTTPAPIDQNTTELEMPIGESYSQSIPSNGNEVDEERGQQAELVAGIIHLMANQLSQCREKVLGLEAGGKNLSEVQEGSSFYVHPPSYVARSIEDDAGRPWVQDALKELELLPTLEDMTAHPESLLNELMPPSSELNVTAFLDLVTVMISDLTECWKEVDNFPFSEDVIVEEPLDSVEEPGFDEDQLDYLVAFATKYLIIPLESNETETDYDDEIGGEKIDEVLRAFRKRKTILDFLVKGSQFFRFALKKTLQKMDETTNKPFIGTAV